MVPKIISMAAAPINPLVVRNLADRSMSPTQVGEEKDGNTANGTGFTFSHLPGGHNIQQSDVQDTDETRQPDQPEDRNAESTNAQGPHQFASLREDWGTDELRMPPPITHSLDNIFSEVYTPYGQNVVEELALSDDAFRK